MDDPGLFIPPTSGCGCRNWRNGYKPLSGHTPEYAAWTGMIARCFNKNNKSYPRYGGRGISMCDRWREDFVAFLTDMGVRPSGCSIERINNDGNYEPGNCRWATKREQANNRRSSRFIEFEARRKTLAEWARETGINVPTLHARLAGGWALKDALTTPIRHKRGES
jgi:hypothetical protein